MAAAKSDLITFQTSCGSAKLMPAMFGGRVRVAHGTVIAGGDRTAGSVIELVKLPKNSRLLPFSRLGSNAPHDDGLLLKVGDRLKSDRYLTDAQIGRFVRSVDLDGDLGNDHIMTAETTVFATITGGRFAAGRKIVFDVLYVID